MAYLVENGDRSICEGLLDIPSVLGFHTPVSRTRCLKLAARQKSRWIAFALGFNLLMCLYLWPIYQGPRIVEAQQERHGNHVSSYGNNLLRGNHVSRHHGNDSSGYQVPQEGNIDVKFSYHGNLVVGDDVSKEDRNGGTRESLSEKPLMFHENKMANLNKKDTDGKDIFPDGQVNDELRFVHRNGEANVDKAVLVVSGGNSGGVEDGNNQSKIDLDKDDVIVKMNHANNSALEPDAGGMDAKESSKTDFHFSPRGRNHDSISFIQEPYSCEENLYLLVIVCSAVQNLHLRAAIRNTWGSAQQRRHLGIKIMFMLGKPAEKFAVLEDAIRNETWEYGDIIQGSFVDHYSNLSIKSLAYLKWVSENCAVTPHFVMKTDDDIFINVRNLIEELNNLFTNNQHHRMVLGNVIEGARPILDRNSKWYTPPSVFNQKAYPKYASGIAYVLSGDLVANLYEESKRTKLFWLEDIYVTGMLAKKLGATLLHNPRFAYVKRKLSPCAYRLGITGHELTDKELYKIWWDIHRSDIDCSRSDLHFNKSDLQARL